MHARAASILIAVAFALALPGGAFAQAYEIPPDNPFVKTTGARGEIYVYGMRNPYRWSFDRLTGDMYVGDVGGTNEEISFLPRAAIAGATWAGTASPAPRSSRDARRRTTSARPSSTRAARTW